MKIKIFILILSLMFVNYGIINNNANVNQSKQHTIKLIQNRLDSLEYIQQYDSVINYIKLHECFRSKPYHTGIDTDKLTIGYGHVIKKTDKIPSIISESFADSLLRRDFKNNMKLLEYYSKKFKDDNYKYQKLAITHFIFAKGIGNYNKSKLKKLVDSNKNISTEIKKWIVIRINGKIYYNKRMLNHRKFEIELYNKKCCC